MMYALENWQMAFDDDWVTGADLASFVDGSNDDLEHKMGREMFEAGEVMVDALFDGKTDKVWIGRALSRTGGLAGGNFYLEAKPGRVKKFRVTSSADLNS